jgi:hypothetical protein
MPTPSFILLRLVLAPVLVAAVIAGIGRWRKWAWAMPVAAGAGFMTGFVLVGGPDLNVPGLPPIDGTDWLFWLAIPLTLLGVIDALAGKRWGWVLGAAAGGAALVVLLPIVPGALSAGEVARVAVLLAVAGAVVTLCAHVAEPAGGPPAVVAGLCVALGGAAVVVMSSHLLRVGLYGIAASAALGAVAVLVGRLPAGRSVAVVAVPLLAALLVGGHYYADPGVSVLNFSVLIAAPALLLLAAAVPGNKAWVRGVIAVIAVAIAVASVTAPTARAAQRAAEATENDPYAAYR